jgi:hypothetical protein
MKRSSAPPIPRLNSGAMRKKKVYDSKVRMRHSLMEWQ